MAVPIKLMIVGDSHSTAVAEAASDWGAAEFSSVAVLRIPSKRGEHAGTPMDEIEDAVRSLEERDLLCSMVGGNQHQMIGLIQHEIPFDIIEPGGTVHATERLLIPYGAMFDTFYEHISEGRDGKHMRSLRGAARCRMVHAAPPPPKEEEADILKKYQTVFWALGIVEKGISPPQLRAKLGRLQVDVLGKICREMGIELIEPPPGTQSNDGFLFPQYHANDATHANAAYGRLVLDQLAAMASAHA
jgi:hypothetical protein